MKSYSVLKQECVVNLKAEINWWEHQGSLYYFLYFVYICNFM